MSFLAGFFCGIVFSWVLSAVALGVMLWLSPRSRSSFLDDPSPHADVFVPSDDQLVFFTHVSDIGASVRGYDD
jgi:hypothetical protein